MEDAMPLHGKILSGCLALVCLAIHSHAAEPFYTNLLNEGKQQYLAGKLDEALESFRIAEFGLVDEKEFVPELYFFYALAQYRKGAVGESQALLDRMKTILGGIEYGKAKRPREIERELSVMLRALEYLAQPGAKPSFLPFLNLFYETWDLLKAKKLEAAEAKLKIMGKMGGDGKRLHFLEGLLSFEKGDHKKCLSRLGKIAAPIPEEFLEDAFFMLAYSHLKRGNKAEGEKFAQMIKNPDHVHRLMTLLEEIKAGHQEKSKK
jgi:hypothetical protein